MTEVREYLDASHRSPFATWFKRLNAPAASKVAMALYRMEQGNFAAAKGVGGGVLEYKIDFGPGYRIYFGRDGKEIVILLAGGIKKRQGEDIRVAKEYWKDYKRRSGGSG